MFQDKTDLKWTIISGVTITLGDILTFNKVFTQMLPKFQRDIHNNWQKYSTGLSELPSCVLTSFLRSNKNILLNSKILYMSYFSNQGLNYVSQLFDNCGNTKSQNNLKNEFHLCEKFHFQFMLYPEHKKNLQSKQSLNQYFSFKSTVCKKQQCGHTEKKKKKKKKNSRELHSITTYALTHHKPTSAIYSKTSFYQPTFDWKKNVPPLKLSIFRQLYTLVPV